MRFDSPSKLALGLIVALLSCSLSLAASAQAAPTVTTLVGAAGLGFSGDGGPASAAQINQPWDTAHAANGDIYIPDTSNNRIRKIDAASGIITTIAGTGTGGYTGDGGPATAATLRYPTNAAVADNGDVYWTELGNYVVRKLDVATGLISTVAGTGSYGTTGTDGVATGVALGSIYGIDVDASGNVYIADNGISRVRKISPAGIISTVAGAGVLSGTTADGGPAALADLNGAYGVAAADDGTLYLSEIYAATIRKVDTAGIITTVAGQHNSAGFSGDGGPAGAALLGFPLGMSLAANSLYIADQNSYRVRKVELTGATISTVAGTGSFPGGPATDGALASASDLYARGVDAHPDGSFHISDLAEGRIYAISAADTTAPETSVVSGPPALTNSASADFEFASSESPASYECSIDAGAFSPCSAVVSFGGLGDGEHTLAVRATDAANNTDQTPAGHSWTVDTTAPVPPTVFSGPSGDTTSADVSFEFAGGAGSSFECSLDSGAFVACASPVSYSALALGAHSFAVRETDAAGNRGAPATRDFTVVAGAPVGTRLCVAKRASRARVSQSQRVRWSVTIRNCGGAPAYDVTASDRLPRSTTLTHRGTALLRRGGTLSWQVGTLAPGQGVRYDYVTRFATDAHARRYRRYLHADASNAANTSASAPVDVP